jgi:hypothetical protein
MHDAEERYRSVEEALLRDPEVARSEKRRGFGSSGLWAGGKLFVMLAAGPGRVMKEWLTVPASSPADWLPLAREAKTFVASRGR